MSVNGWSRVRAILEAASALPDDAGRRAYVREQTGDDAALRDEALSLLDALDAAGPFLSGTRVGPASRLEPFGDPERLPERIGPWRIARAIGRGGMGVVYLGSRDAGDVTLQAAIKVVAGAADSADIVRRFRTERRILAALDHPGIARLLDGGSTDEGLPYFALEYVEGTPLTEHVQSQRLDLRARLALFLEVCAAVEFAHRRLVIHRDLKPGNILVGADGRPKLLDFGIAKILAAADTDAMPATVTSRGWMTPAYASPEQLRGEPTSAATDVYALGLVLYEVLTGTRAFAPTADPVETARARFEGTVARPSVAVLRSGDAGARPTAEVTRLSRALRGDLDTIVLKSIAAEPARRYATAAELAAELERYLTGRPVQARPDTYRYRAGKFVRRHRWAVGFAGLAAAGLVTGLAFALVGQQRAQQAEAAARTSAATAERVSEFMVGLFSVSDPGEARGNAVTARELLDRGAERVTKELGSDPGVRSRLRGVMARAYRELGLYEQQAQILRSEIEDVTRRGGLASAEGLSLLTDLAYAEGRRGRYAEARDLAERAVAGLEALSPPPGARLAAALSQSGIAHWQLGDLARARDRLEASLALLDAIPDPEPRDMVGVLNNVAILRWQKGDVDGARPLYQRALDLSIATRGEDHPTVAHTLNNMALLELRARRFDASLALHDRALALRRRLLAPDHPDVAESLHNICDAALAQGNLATARRACEDALAIRRAIFTDPHPLVATTESNLGLVLVRQGDLAAGREMLERALSGFERRLGPTHMWLSYPLEGLADVERASGRPAQAEPLLRRALTIRERALGPAHDEVAGARGKLAALLREIGRASEADALLADVKK